MDIISLDFETYYDSECSLKRLTYLEYINHPKFKVHMVGLKQNDKPTEVIETRYVHDALRDHFPQGNKNIMVGHNLMFDGLICEACYGIRAAEYHDTKAMFNGIAPYLPGSLEEMAKAIFPDQLEIRKGDELAQSKGVITLTDVLYPIIASYCANDTDITYDSYCRMLEFFPPEELEIISETLKMWIEPKLILDQERVTRHLAQIQEHKKRVIAESGVAKTTLSSNPKFAEWIESQGIEVPTKLNNKGKETFAFAKDDLEFIELRKDHPEHEKVWEARIEAKSTLEETRATRMLRNAELDNGQLRAPLNYYGAHTGRYSGTQKINLQNLQRGSELRLSLCAKTGEYIYVSDLSQIEARMNAWLSEEHDLVQAFRDKVDPYCKFATERIYHREITKADTLERFVGKVAILGLGYGMSGNKFRETLAKGAMGPPVFFTPEEADEIVYNGYRKAYRGIVRNWKIGDRAIKHMLLPDAEMQWGPTTVSRGRIALPNDMYLNYPNLQITEFPDGQQIEYWNGKFMASIYGGKLVENVVQALARIVVMQQLLKIKKKMPHLKYALQVHDELIFTGPQTNADQTMADIIGYMSEAPDWCSDLPVAAEGGYDVNYSK